MRFTPTPKQNRKIIIDKWCTNPKNKKNRKHKTVLGFISKKTAATKKIANALAQEIVRTGSLSKKNACVVALSGDLGAGKTTFIQGFMKGLGVRQTIQSPTFVLFKKFLIPHGSKKHHFKNAIHVDAYRLKNEKELLALGFHNELQNTNNIILIEWMEKIKKLLPKHHISVRFFHRKPREREIYITEKVL